MRSAVRLTRHLAVGSAGRCDRIRRSEKDHVAVRFTSSDGAAPSVRVHPHRAAGGDRHHLGPGRDPLPGLREGARERPEVDRPEQPQADRRRPADVYRRLRRASAEPVADLARIQGVLLEGGRWRSSRAPESVCQEPGGLVQPRRPPVEAGRDQLRCERRAGPRMASVEDRQACGGDLPHRPHRSRCADDRPGPTIRRRSTSGGSSATRRWTGDRRISPVRTTT